MFVPPAVPAQVMYTANSMNWSDGSAGNGAAGKRHHPGCVFRTDPSGKACGHAGGTGKTGQKTRGHYDKESLLECADCDAARMLHQSSCIPSGHCPQRVEPDLDIANELPAKTPNLCHSGACRPVALYGGIWNEAYGACVVMCLELDRKNLLYTDLPTVTEKPWRKYKKIA